jgi:uncharacterized iron-regulated membrane protein
VLHRICGLIGAIFLIVISITGFLLALKGQVSAIKVPTQKGTQVATSQDIIHPAKALEVVFGLGIAELAEAGHVDRLELHLSKNVYKVTSKEGYHEVQVDVASGRILSVGTRKDQLLEDIHDLSYFNPAFRIWVLPVVATLLFALGTTGLYIYFNPIVRRIQFNRSKRHAQPPPPKP